MIRKCLLYIYLATLIGSWSSAHTARKEMSPQNGLDEGTNVAALNEPPEEPLSLTTKNDIGLVGHFDYSPHRNILRTDFSASCF